MKKILLVLFFILSGIAVPSNAVPGGALVIIDSYFDARIPNTTIVCVAKDNCVNKAKPSAKLSDPVNQQHRTNFRLWAKVMK